jgi:hypothetical protein
MTVAELMDALKDQPPDRRVMLYDFEQHDQWLDIRVEVTEVKPPEGSVAKYGTGHTIVSIGL